MTSFSQTSLIRFLFAGLLIYDSLNYAAGDEAGDEARSFSSQASSPLRPYQDPPSLHSPSFSPFTQESLGERSPSPSFSARMAPWALSQIVVDSWRLTDLNDIGPLTEMAARLQYTLPDNIVAHIMSLGARYIHESQHSYDLTIGRLIRFLETLGQIEQEYPRGDSLSSTFAYNAMIEEHRKGEVNSWRHQSHYLWLATTVFHETGGDAEITSDILRWSNHFIYTTHTYDQRGAITQLIQDIVLHNLGRYVPIFSSILYQTRGYESFQIIPFLEGCVSGLTHRAPLPAFSPMWSPAPTPGYYSSGNQTPIGSETAARTPGYESSSHQTPLGWRPEERSPHFERQTSEKEAHADWRYFNHRTPSHDADDERTDTPPAEENLK